LLAAIARHNDDNHRKNRDTYYRGDNYGFDDRGGCIYDGRYGREFDPHKHPQDYNAVYHDGADPLKEPIRGTLGASSAVGGMPRQAETDAGLPCST
jgi:hypothetical protein